MTVGHGLWDRLGCIASCACTVHCLAAPFLFLVLPAFAELWAHPASHALMALLVVPLALTVVIYGYRRHRVHWVLGAVVLGIAFILAGSALPYLSASELAPAEEAVTACDHCCPSVVEDETGESQLHIPPAAIATVIGSLFLIAAHIGNWRGSRCCVTAA